MVLSCSELSQGVQSISKIIFLKKITTLNKEKKNIIKYPHVKNRYLLTKFCFIAKFNYIFRTQYPWDTQCLLPAFDEMQGEIALSLFNEDLDHFDEDMTMFVGEATKLSTRLGGLGLREQHFTLLSAFISSITSCVYDLSRKFPSYIQTGGPERNFQKGCKCECVSVSERVDYKPA